MDNDTETTAPTVPVTVTVLHTSDLSAYILAGRGDRIDYSDVTDRDGNPVTWTEVFTFPANIDPGADGVLTLCETAFQVFNIGETGIAADYRAKDLRSLSCGDRLRIAYPDSVDTYEVASFGFERVTD